VQDPFADDYEGSAQRFRDAEEALLEREALQDDTFRPQEGRAPRLIVSAAEFLAEKDSAEVSLFGDGLLVAASGYTIVSGQGGVGKTLLLAGLFIQMAAGASEFLGFRLPGERVPVVILQAEGSRPKFRERMRVSAMSYGHDLADLPIYFHHRDVRLALEEKLLSEIIRRSGARALLLDPIGRFHGGDENHATEWRKFVTHPLARIGRGLDVAVAFADHYVKPSDNRRAQHKLRGSGAKLDDCGAAMRLEYSKGGKSERVLIVDRVRDGAIPEPDRIALRVDLIRGHVELAPDGVAEAIPDSPHDERRNREKEERVLKAQERIEGALKRLEAAADWNAADGVSERKLAQEASLSRNGEPFERALAALTAQGAIEKALGGGWRRVRR
jgi:hypothetical protein